MSINLIYNIYFKQYTGNSPGLTMPLHSTQEGTLSANISSVNERCKYIQSRRLTEVPFILACIILNKRDGGQGGSMVFLFFYIHCISLTD